MKLLSLLLCLILLACSTKSNKLTRQQILINRELFYGIDKKLDSITLLNEMSQDMANAFSLAPITKSTAEREIRVYFSSVWQEVFFLLTYQNGSLTVELYNCETDRKKDSLFMKIHTLIRGTGKYDIAKITKADTLPILRNCIIKDTVDYLDKGFIYFIQTKSGKSFKTILMNDNCELLQNDQEITHIKNFIQSLNKNFNFTFYDPWTKIDSLAFLNQ